MASVAYVESTQVLQVNNIPLYECPKTASIPCEGTQLQGIYWGVPIMGGGIQTGWQWVIQATQPTADSVRAIRLWDPSTSTTWYIAVTADQTSEEAFVSRCNACCGTTPSMPTVTYQAPVYEECPCAVDVNGTNTYTYYFPVPTNPNALNYLITSSSFNQVAGTPAPAGGGYANIAAVLTFLQTAVTGWAAYGTWSLVNSNTLIKLVSTTVTCAGLNLSLLAKSYCFAIPDADTTANGMRIGGQDLTFPLVHFSDDSASTRQAIVDAIRPFLIGDLVIVGSGPYYVKYTGFQVPNRLNLNGAAVSGTTFATGTCP